MKINLRKSSKKLCVLLFLCLTAITFVPTAFAGKDGPEQLPPAKKTLSRDYFTTEEDNRLIQLVEQYGAQNWSGIANFMPGRSARQCRERWKNYLNPEISNEPWTPEEDQILLDKYKEFGKKWSQIAKFFNKRTDINVKNRFHFLERQEKRSQKHFSDSMNQLKAPAQKQNPAPSQPQNLIRPSYMTNVSLNVISTQITNQTFIQQSMTSVNQNLNATTDLRSSTNAMNAFMSTSLVANQNPSQTFIPQSMISTTQNFNITTGATNSSISTSLIVNQGLNQHLTQTLTPTVPDLSTTTGSDNFDFGNRDYVLDFELDTLCWPYSD